MGNFWKKTTLYYLSILLAIFSCTKDFVVVDIDGKTLIVNAPANDLITSINLVTFWWEPLDGAEKYNLQVVKPSFAAVSQLILDTNITGNKFNMTLNPGKYQWRIKATNAGHSTIFQTFNLTLDSTSNLTNQLVNPLGPLNGFVTGNSSITFSWSEMSSASQYQIQINDGAITNTLVSATAFSYTLPALAGINNAFSWKVKAINANSISQFNSAQTFTIDRLPPYVSSPLTPTSNAGTSKNITSADTLTWQRAAVVNTLLDTKYDSLFISTDSLFAPPNVLARMRVNSTIVIVGNIIPTIPVSTGATPYYYWRLNSVDSSGNRSTAYSYYYKFKLVP